MPKLVVLLEVHAYLFIYSLIIKLYTVILHICALLYVVTCKFILISLNVIYLG